ncbi:MAG: hypothetical protein HZB56_09045 [Deltaproteobacteria bacterium]|nr:hypothetical protein [Deltaproteobacteria bacterium]
MPQVNWDAFAALSGAATSNFELLCRALIRRHYGRFGRFAALASQPGVEFHLRIDRACTLGDPGRWFGWQCRWYDLAAGKALGKTRRDKIAKALKTTERELPGLTDWVLWTRRPLTEGDQKWFFGLESPFKLHLWTASEVEEHLSGDAEILRATYFGELVFSPEDLKALHGSAAATVRPRWLPEVHQSVEAERELRRFLGEVASWGDLRETEKSLLTHASTVEGAAGVAPSVLRPEIARMPGALRGCASALATAASALDTGDFDLLRQVTQSRPAVISGEFVGLPRQLRAARSAAVFAVTDALATLKAAAVLLDEVGQAVGVRSVAVVADAGGGKTQLSAQLTASVEGRPAGVLLFGRDLHSRDNLTDLVRRSISIRGTPVPSIEALVAAIDAAGQRAHRRLPLVIDGLNEAEDARDWKAPLAALNELLESYPYVVAVCTVRGAFAEEALPSAIVRLEMTGFDEDLRDAAVRYFTYFRIDWRDAELPFELLRHPLTLRLFCEVTNPRRDKPVSIDKGPGSLAALFDRYLEIAAGQIASLAPASHRYYDHDARNAVDEIGKELWRRRGRSIPRSALRVMLGEQGRSWQESIVRALEHEGVLLAVPGDAPGDPHEAVVYDALAGHMIASHVIGARGSDHLEEWLNASEVVTALSAPHDGRHPLAADIVTSLVALVPRRGGHKQAWQIAPAPLRLTALRQAAELEGAYLDAATVRELADLITTHRDGVPDILDRLVRTRGLIGHPLNAEFLDGALRAMPVAQRDLRWTEWLRRNADAIQKGLESLESYWRRRDQRGPADVLRAKWVMWTLTSTVRRLRDQATRTLYWFGRADLGALLTLVADALSIDDAYVPERAAAAGYGVVMAQQPSAEASEPVLARFLARIGDELVGAASAHPTSHYLIRLFVDGIFSFATKFCPNAIPQAWRGRDGVPFVRGPVVEAIPDNDVRAKEVDRTLGMDFSNYTIGGLIEGRGNYQMEHAGYRAALAHVRGVVWSIGWRKALFDEIDNELGGQVHRGVRADIERYGKKYGWSGYYTLAGELDEEGRLPDREERLADVDIDPSFPEDPPPDVVKIEGLTAQFPGDDKRWLVEGEVRVPDELLYRDSIRGRPGPWVAVYAFLNSREELERRRVFAFVSGLFVAKRDVPRVVKALREREYPGNHWLPEPRTAYYSFAGEIPWHPDFVRHWGEVADYTHELELGNAASVKIEALAHEYGWETYHSQLNRAGGAMVPSAWFSRQFDLRPVPNGFDQMLPDGSFAAISLRAPEAFSGHIVYLREDLLERYANGRRLVWFAWGEREIRRRNYADPPSWVMEAIQKHQNVWRWIRLRNDLSSRGATSARARPSRSRRGQTRRPRSKKNPGK